MIDIQDKTECSGCSACKNICPRNAISMVEDEYGFLYPHINYNACINCNLCEKVCPIINSSKEELEVPKAYAAFNKDEKIRMQSSSGGVFTLLASKIINMGGVVYGASFNEKFLVVHDKAKTKEEIQKFRGSKYIQSELKNVFKEIRNLLQDDKYVLFTGTPCQVEGLKSFLGKEYSKLYTQDLICHGVPSKKVWEKYLESKEKINNSEIKNVSFRNKENKGWNKYQIFLEYQKNKEYIDHSEDIFMKIFLNDIALRDSCYKCKFKKKHRISDITLADFWGINNVIPKMNDEKGTSLVIVNSKKGQDLMNEIKENIVYEEVDFEKAISNNLSMTTSPLQSEKREEFFKDLENYDFEYLIEKYKI